MASGLPGEDAKTTPLTTLQIVGQICWGCQTSPTKTSGPLKKCSQCRRAVYCSPKCQKADWSRGHKPLCKRFQELNAFDGQISLRRNAKTHDAHMERQGARHQLFCRPTPENEYGDGQSYVFDQAICDVCYRTPFQGSQYQELVPCQRCKLRFHCSTPACEGRFSAMHRPAWCKQLQDVACVQRVLLAYSKARPLNYTDYIVQASEHQRRTYVPLASAAGWDDYYKRFWPGFEDFILVLATELKHADPRVEYGLTCMMQDTHSRPVTIVAALEAALPDIAKRRELVVHVAAASGAEWHTRGALEDVLHFFPALRSLTMVYAGPEIPPDLAADASVRAQNFACASCKSTGRRRKSVYFHDVHHDFMKSPEYTRHPPDLVIAFNTGFSEIDEDSWTPTLDALLDSGVPTAFTAYSLTEAKMEEDVLAKKGARFIVPVGENKWRGGSARTPNAHPDTLTYTNTAWYVVRGRM